MYLGQSAFHACFGGCAVESAPSRLVFGLLVLTLRGWCCQRMCPALVSTQQQTPGAERALAEVARLRAAEIMSEGSSDVV